MVKSIGSVATLVSLAAAESSAPPVQNFTHPLDGMPIVHVHADVDPQMVRYVDTDWTTMPRFGYTPDSLRVRPFLEKR